MSLGCPGTWSSFDAVTSSRKMLALRQLVHAFLRRSVSGPSQLMSAFELSEIGLSAPMTDETG